MEAVTDTKWRWDFSSPAELRRALEEYTALQEGAAIRKYGHDGVRVLVDEWGNDVLDEDGHPVLVVDPEPVRDPESGARTEFDKARIRSEIDACMERIRTRYPHWWWLLEVYYRQGRSLEPRGWIATAILLGVHKSRCPALMRCPVSPGDNRSGWDVCQRHDKYH